MDYKEISRIRNKSNINAKQVTSSVGVLNVQITKLRASIDHLSNNIKIHSRELKNNTASLAKAFKSASIFVGKEMAKEVARSIPRTAIGFMVEKLKETARFSKEASITMAKVATKPVTLPVNFAKEVAQSIQQSEFRIDPQSFFTLALGSPLTSKIVRTVIASPFVKTIFTDIKDMFKSIGRTIWRGITLPYRIFWGTAKRVGGFGKEAASRVIGGTKEKYQQYKMEGREGEIPSLQKGGYVKKQGLVNVHPAEVITPISKIIGFKKFQEKNLKAQEKIIFELKLLKLALTGTLSGFNQMLNQFFLKHPFFSKLATGFKFFTNIIDTPIKFLRKRRGGYWRDLPKGGLFGKSPFAQQVDILGALYANLLHKQDVIINLLKQIGYRIVDPTRGGKGWGPMIVKDDETWSIGGVIRRAGSLLGGIQQLFQMKKQEKLQNLLELKEILTIGGQEDLNKIKGYIPSKVSKVGGYISAKTSPYIEQSKKFLLKETRQLDNFLENQLGETYTKVKTTTTTAIESVKKQTEALQTAVAYKFDELKLSIEWKKEQTKRNLKHLWWYKQQGKKILRGEGILGLAAILLAGPLGAPLLAGRGYLTAKEKLKIPESELKFSDKLVSVLGEVLSMHTGYMFADQMTKEMYYAKELAAAKTPEEREKTLKLWKQYNKAGLIKAKSFSKKVTSTAIRKLHLQKETPKPLKVGAVEIKKEGLFRLHKGESVIPEDIAEKLRQFFGNKNARYSEIISKHSTTELLLNKIVNLLTKIEENTRKLQEGGGGVGPKKKNIVIRATVGTAKATTKVVSVPFNAGMWVINQFASGIKNSIGAVVKVAQGIASVFVDSITGITKLILKTTRKAFSLVEDLAKTTVKGIQLAFGGVKATVKGIFGLVGGAWDFVTFKSLRTKISEKIKEKRLRIRERKKEEIQIKTAKTTKDYIILIYQELKHIRKNVSKRGFFGTIFSFLTSILSNIGTGIASLVAFFLGGMFLKNKERAKFAAITGSKIIANNIAKESGTFASKETAKKIAEVTGTKLAKKSFVSKLLETGKGKIGRIAERIGAKTSGSFFSKVWLSSKSGIQEAVASLGKTGAELWEKWGVKGISLVKGSPFYKWAASKISSFLNKTTLKSIPVAGIIAQLGFGLWDILHAKNWKERLAIAIGAISGVGTQAILDVTGYGALVSGVGAVGVEYIVRNKILHALESKNKAKIKMIKDFHNKEEKLNKIHANNLQKIYSDHELKTTGSGSKKVIPQNKHIISPPKKENILKRVIQKWGSLATWASNKVSKETGIHIPNTLILADIAQESAGDPNAMSSVGARGLMQITPATAQYLSSKIGLSAKLILSNPRANILAGTYYLASLYHRFHNWKQALQAYNWGPGNVQKYLQGQKTSIPLETQKYAPGVFANAKKIMLLASSMGNNLEEVPMFGNANSIKTAMLVRQNRMENLKQQKIVNELKKSNEQVAGAIEKGTKTNVAMMAPVVNTIINQNNTNSSNQQGSSNTIDKQLDSFLSKNDTTV